MASKQSVGDVSALSYEEARDELVSVVSALEQGAATLEESLALWERGEALATIRPHLESARIMPMPEMLVPGQRQVSIDGAQKPFVVDQAGAFSAGDLDRLVVLPMTAAALESKGSTSEVPLRATLTLRTPVDAATLPASAVVTDNRVTCVITQHGPAIVSVVSSTVGQSVGSFVGNAPAAESVRLSPGSEARCG